MNPIIALWSHPRSMSTAMERVMRERGDLDCAHEPFMYDYYVGRGVSDMPGFDVMPDHPTTYAGIRDMLLTRADSAPVFFKDMAYYVVPQIFDDPDFIARLTHCFLIRNPVASILSYHKLDPGLTCPEIGIEAQWQLYAHLVAAGQDPVVIEAEAVRADVRGMLGALWQRIDLPWRDEAFDWQEVPQDWAQVGAWHGSVSAASGIKPADVDEVAQKAQAFETLVQTAPHLQGFLEHHLPFYEKLKAVSM